MTCKEFKFYLRSKHPELMALARKLPPEVVRILAENAESFEGMDMFYISSGYFSPRFNLSQIIIACEILQEEGK